MVGNGNGNKETTSEKEKTPGQEDNTWN